MSGLDTIAEEWRNLRNAIIEAADGVIVRKEREKENNWFDQEWKLVIEKKNVHGNWCDWLKSIEEEDYEHGKQKMKEAKLKEYKEVVGNL